MKNLENGTEFIWPKEKFLNRLYLMKEMYNNYEEEDDDWDLPEVSILSMAQIKSRRKISRKGRQTYSFVYTYFRKKILSKKT